MAAIATTVIVLFWEACMSASATSEKRLLLLLLLDADRRSVSRPHSSTRRCDLSLRRGRPRLSIIRRRNQQALRWTTMPRAVVSANVAVVLGLVQSRHRNDGPRDVESLGLLAPTEVAGNRSKMDRPGSGREPYPTRPAAGRLICNRVGSGRAARHIATNKSGAHDDAQTTIRLSGGRVRRL